MKLFKFFYHKIILGYINAYKIPLIKQPVQFNTGIEIKIPDFLKTSKPGSIQPNLILPYFIEKPNLCVATTILTYLDKTKNLRGDIKKLFISVKKPFASVTTQTISRWIKTVLHKEGIL